VGEFSRSREVARLKELRSRQHYLWSTLVVHDI
jgi:hypothetical protein